MKQLLSNFLRDEQGQDLVEYTLLLAFVALAGAALFTGLNTKLATVWSTANTVLGNANTAAGS